MSEINITVEGGTSKRLLTAGKYCDRDIVVTATGGGAEEEYVPVPCIRFTGDQIVDTGIICNQNTKIRIIFMRDDDASMYMYGVASAGNTASVTAYLTSSGGSWRFGNKNATKVIATNEELVQTAVVSKTGIVMANSNSTFSGVANFETVGTMLVGSCRNADGTVGSAQFIGRIVGLEMWDGAQVLKLCPVMRKDGVYGFKDDIKGNFHTSITDIPLEGGQI